MTQRRFEPNSPTLMNAGRPLGQLSRVLRAARRGRALQREERHLRHAPGDGAHPSVAAAAPASASRGCAPKGAMVRSTTGVASGPVSFMKLYDASTDAVKQGGTRRGANMGILRVDHPDIMEFITCKEDLTQMTNFNISVAVTDEFMEAVKPTRSYDLIDPDDRQGRRPARRARGVGQDDPRRLAHRRAGRVLHRRGQPLQPGAAPRRVRGDEPLRRAAAAAVRRLQPRLDQRRASTCDGRARWTGTRSAGKSISRRTSSTTSSTSTSIRCRRSTRCPSASAASGSA